MSKRPRPVIAHPSDPTLALVELTRGYWAVIDAVDAEAAGEACWHIRKQKNRNTAYATRSYGVGANRVNLQLHRVVADRMGLRSDVEIDHKNGNGLDCTRKNLRPAERWQNAANIGITSKNRSGIKGVYWDSTRMKWVGKAKGNGREIGRRFDTRQEAEAFAVRARAELHRDFANHGTRENLQ